MEKEQPSPQGYPSRLLSEFENINGNQNGLPAEILTCARRQSWEEAISEYNHAPMEIPSSFSPYQEAKKCHLIFVSLKGPWFYINGEKELRFKTRGNNRQDLANALSRYDIDFWECDFEQVVRDTAVQLKAQADAKNAPIKLEAIA